MKQNILQILFTNEIVLLLMKYPDIWCLDILNSRQLDHHFKNDSKSKAPSWFTNEILNKIEIL